MFRKIKVRDEPTFFRVNRAVINDERLEYVIEWTRYRVWRPCSTRGLIACQATVKPTDIHRLEAETEAANRGFVFCTLGDITYASDVGVVKRLAEVR